MQDPSDKTSQHLFSFKFMFTKSSFSFKFILQSLNCEKLPKERKKIEKTKWFYIIFLLWDPNEMKTGKEKLGPRVSRGCSLRNWTKARANSWQLLQMTKYWGGHEKKSSRYLECVVDGTKKIPRY